MVIAKFSAHVVTSEVRQGCRGYASVRPLSLHTQIAIKELQRGVPDVLVQLGPIHARGIGARLRIVIACELIALIAEDLVTNPTVQHVEVGTGDIFGGK